MTSAVPVIDPVALFRVGGAGKAAVARARSRGCGREIDFWPSRRPR